jgi:hypothetical protein
MGCGKLTPNGLEWIGFDPVAGVIPGQSSAIVPRLMAASRPTLAYTFGALRETFGPLYVRCDICRRHVKLPMAGLRDVDYRRRTFSCTRCGPPGYLAISDPVTEKGMEDYRLDPVAETTRHPDAVPARSARASSAQQWRAARPQG